MFTNVFEQINRALTPTKGVLAFLFLILVSYVLFGNHALIPPQVSDALNLGIEYPEGSFYFDLFPDLDVTQFVHVGEEHHTNLEHMSMEWMGLIGITVIQAMMLGSLVTMIRLPFYSGALFLGLIHSGILGHTTFVHELQNPSSHMSLPVGIIIFLAFWAILQVISFLGTELDEEKMLDGGKDSLIGAALGIVAPMALVPFGYWIFRQDVSFYTLLGLGMTSAATSVTIKVLLFDRLGLLKSIFATAIFMMALFDDILTAMTLTVGQSVFAGEDGVVVIALTALGTFFIAVSLLYITIKIGSRLGDSAIDLAHNTKLSSDEALLLAMLSYAMVISWGFANIGQSFVLGAFIAGSIFHEKSMERIMNNNGKDHAHNVVAMLRGAKVLPLVFLFYLVGVNMKAEYLFQELPIILWLTLLAVIGKQIIGFVFRRHLGQYETFRERLIVQTLIGLSMVARFDVGSMIALLLKGTLAAGVAVFGPLEYNIAMGMVLGTTIVASWSMNVLVPMYQPLVERFTLLGSEPKETQ